MRVRETCLQGFCSVFSCEDSSAHRPRICDLMLALEFVQNSRF